MSSFWLCIDLQQYTGVPVHHDIFLPWYEYCILNKVSQYLRYIHICINKHEKALSSISAHPPSEIISTVFIDFLYNKLRELGYSKFDGIMK